MTIQSQKSSRMLRTAEAAYYCGISKSTLDKYRVTGEGPVFVKLGRAVVYDITNLNEWLESRKVTSTSGFGRD